MNFNKPQNAGGQNIPPFRSRRFLILMCFSLFGYILLAAGSNTLLAQDTPAEAAPKKERPQKLKSILFLGNSLTAGFGIDANQAFPALIQKKINRQNWPFKVINAGLSGETSSGGLRRINWLMKKHLDVLVLELGANDGLRGISLDLTEKNLRAIIAKMRKKFPQIRIVLAGMEIPPNMGDDYTRQFRSMYRNIARETGATLIPFILDGVGGKPELNLADGIHPTAEGHSIVAETVWKTIRPLLAEMLAAEQP